MNEHTTTKSSFTTGKRHVTKRKVRIEKTPTQKKLQYSTRYVEKNEERTTIISPIKFSYTNKGEKSIQARTLADEISDNALIRGQRSTRRAIKMANALQLETELESGVWSQCRGHSIRSFAVRVGISRNTLTELLDLLNRPVGEIENILYETE